MNEAFSTRLYARNSTSNSINLVINRKQNLFHLLRSANEFDRKSSTRLKCNIFHRHMPGTNEWFYAEVDWKSCPKLIKKDRISLGQPT